MRNRLRQQRGFALMAVLGITVLLMVYLVSVQGSLEMTRAQARLAAQRQNLADDVASLVALAMASPQASSGAEPLDLPNGHKGRFTREPLPEGHAFWRTAPLLKPLAGDELLTVELPGDALGAWRARFMINRQGTRPGVVTVENVAPVRTDAAAAVIPVQATVDLRTGRCDRPYGTPFFC